MDRDKIKTLLIPSDTDIKRAMQMLNETAERILFVVDSTNILIGTVTDGDIRRGIIRGVQLNETVREIMNCKFISVNTDTLDCKKLAIELMQKYHIDHIPVIDKRGIIEDIVLWTECLISKGKHNKKVPVDMSKHPVVIMAGGKGTRLDPLTKILPKPLIPFQDKPIIEHVMCRFNENGFSKFTLILNYKKEMIKMYFSENKLPYEMDFIEEGDYYGTGGGLSLLKGKIRDTFVITNCDTILEGDYRDFLNWHMKQKNLLTIIGSHKEIIVPYGVLSMDNGMLDDIDEKPKIDLFINTGTYVAEPEITNFIDENQFIDMDKLIKKLKKEHQKVGVYPYWGEWFDIGQWDEYRRSLKKIGEQTD